jgi:acyl-CoA reductase-like NAD-dependent aldehyde dehydrogenase
MGDLGPDTELRLFSPWNRQEIGRIPAATAADAVAAVARARAAQPGWAACSFAERARFVLAARDRFARNADAMVDLLVRENGKPSVEAWFAEIVPNLDLFTYWATNAERMLRTERVALDRLKFPGKTARVRLVPKGVVAVVSAWNYPVALALRAIVPALMAGNTVVFKPATDAMLVCRLLAECFTEVLPSDAFVPVLGPGAVGSAIVEAGVDHLVFIGSVDVGREVAALAGRHFVSCALELGGKDAAIVLPDADPDRAIEGIVWGAFTNGGQNCASIERLLVQESVADSFLERLARRTEALRVCRGAPEGSDVGPLRNAGQLRTVAAQVEDAVAKGAKVRCGGKAVGEGFGYLPTILDGVTDDMIVWNEETFGPLLPVRRFRDPDEAIRLANANRYGLTNSVWTRNVGAAQKIAERLECGVVTINNHAFSAGIPTVPWGGVKWTGMGSTNSHHALAEMVRPQLVLSDKPAGHEPWWYPYDETNLALARALPSFILAKKGTLKVLGLIRRASRAR